MCERCRFEKVAYCVDATAAGWELRAALRALQRTPERVPALVVTPAAPAQPTSPVRRYPRDEPYYDRSGVDCDRAREGENRDG